MAIDGNQLRVQDAMQAGRRSKVEMGIFPGNGPAPYGYVKVGERGMTRLEIASVQAEVVRMIFHWFVHDQVSVAEIMRRLEGQSIPPPGKPDRQGRKAAAMNWRRETVRQILQHEVYAGTFYANRYRRISNTSSTLRPRSEWLPISVPTIVDRQVWNRAQERSPATRTPAHSHQDYLMRGRLRCACGYATFGTAATNGMGRVYRYYECGQRHRRYTQCAVLNTRADKVDAAVWGWVCDLLRNPCMRSTYPVITTSANTDRSLQSVVHDAVPELEAADLALRRRVVDELNLMGTLAREDGRRVLYLQWSDTTHKLWVDEVKGASSRNTSTTGREYVRD